MTAGPEHPIRVVRDPETGEPAPYVMVRRGMEALIDRKSFYRLVELGCEETVDGVGQFGTWSDGVFFAFIPADELASAGPSARIRASTPASRPRARPAAAAGHRHGPSGHAPRRSPAPAPRCSPSACSVAALSRISAARRAPCRSVRSNW